ncbi:MAG: ABC transporter substrate-binding protein, partial [Candidatus Dormibacteraceae bacterium]
MTVRGPSRSFSRWWLRAAALCAVALLAAACGGATTTGKHTASSTPKSGGVVTYALPSLVTINWYQPLRPAPFNTTYDAWSAQMMYQELYTIAPTGKIDYGRSIASDISWNSAGTVYTVTMNPKWHWSDGKPVTSADVLFAWQLIQAASSPNAPAPWPYASSGTGGVPSDIKSVESLGTYKFQVTTTQPMNQIWFEYNGLSQFTPLPKQSWDKYPTDVTQELAYVTSNGANPSFFK